MINIFESESRIRKSLQWIAFILLFFGGILLDPAHQTEAAQPSGTTPITCGDKHSFALKSDGTVWAWGWNNFNQLGDGTTIERSTPVQVQGLSGVTVLASGWYHGLALKSDGTVWAWGSNGYSGLGDGTTMQRSTPVQVKGLSGVIALAGGTFHSLALKSDGTVWAWGANLYGKLGDGTTVERLTPVQVQGLSGVIALASGGHHSLALKSDGTVWAWGLNSYSQLGDGTTINRSTPVQVKGLSGVIALAGRGGNHSHALKSDGTVWVWGDYHPPMQVQGLSRVVALASGENHDLALKSDGTVWAWGSNQYGTYRGGQLGDGTKIDRKTPVQVKGLSGVIDVACGSNHSLALKSDGTVWSWGPNLFLLLGDGTNIDRTTPVQVLGPGSDGYLNLGSREMPSSIKVLYNGTPLSFDTPPVLQDGRVLVPIRPVAVAMGAQVSWDPSTQTVGFALGNISVRLTIGSSTAYVNSQQKQLDVPAQIIGGSTMVPLRFISEGLGAEVGWDPATRTASITYNLVTVTPKVILNGSE